MTRPTASELAPHGITAICYLGFDDGRYPTGACLHVDGGYAMDG